MSGKHCSGVELVVTETKQFAVENAKVVGPNAISFQMATRKDEQWHVFGCYFVSFNKEEAAQHLDVKAVHAVPEGSKPHLIGNLNSNLDFSWDMYVDK